MLQVKTFYAVETHGADTVQIIQKKVNTFLSEMSPYNKVVSIHPAMVDMPETENTREYMSYSVMITYEANI